MGKPLKIKTRRCKRCEILYNTEKKFSTICDDCKKPSGGWALKEKKK